MNRQAIKTGVPFYYFDENGVLCIPSLKLAVPGGEAVSLLGVKGTDISYIYNKFNQEDPIRQRQRGPRFLDRGHSKNPHTPVIHCVSRKVNLFSPYSAYDNFLLSDRRVLPHNRKRLREMCEDVKQRFGIDIDFNVPLNQLRTSDKIMVDIVRAYLTDGDVYVFDNLFSLLELDHRNILIAMAGDMIFRGKRVLYLTTKWEHAVVISSRTVVFMDNAVLGEADTESVKKNPQHLIYLMSGRTLVEQNSQQTETAELLSMLYTGAEYLADNYELADALRFVASNISQVLHCDSAAIYLMDERTSQLHPFSHQPNLVGEGLSDSFIRFRMKSDKKGSIFYSTIEDPHFADFFEGGSGEVKTLLCVPVFVKSQVQGILALGYNSLFVYNEQQVLYLKSFIKEIAIIIETSQLMGNSILLQESNHRIKNNLQIIINLISMQQLYARQHPDHDVDAVLDSIVSRVKNIANVHEMLSAKNTNEAAIDLQRIIKSVLRAFELHGVTVEVESDDILIPYSKATSISMVINELITNSVKYAFGGREDNVIRITCRRDSDSIRIGVEDNGWGIEQDFNIQDSLSIGFSIIRTIVKIDLRGRIDIKNSGHGTRADIVIPSYL